MDFQVQEPRRRSEALDFRPRQLPETATEWETQLHEGLLPPRSYDSSGDREPFGSEVRGKTSSCPEITSASSELGSIQETAAPPVGGWEAYCARKREPLQVELGQRLSRGFPEPISGDCRELKETYRSKLDRTPAQARHCRLPTLIKSVEGIGKTSALQAIVAGEALQHAMDAHPTKEQGFRHESFGAFAFRSRDQAEKKAKEFSEANAPTVVIRPFWEHVRAACRELGLPEITRDEFDNLTLSSILQEIDPEVYEQLERQRKNLWSEARFDGGSTLLMMTHKNAELWPMNDNCRAWHHPEFDPAGDPEEHKKLAGGIRLLEVVFDDPEVDEFVNLLPESRYEFLNKRQKQFSGWRNLKLKDRREAFGGLYKEAKSLGIPTFEDFDELMRLELTSLKPFHVDYERFKYGQDNPYAITRGIYRPKHGHGYYIGLKPWLSQMGDTVPTFLTTEEVVAQTIKKAYGQRLLSLELDNLPGLFPIKVPVFIEKRAKSDRVQAEELNVSALAQEILEADKNAVVISDGVKDIPGVYTFQGMKGLNGLEDRNIYIILTWMAPEKYAELNVLGQWLGNENILLDYCQDQINQAVGRNRGFRQSQKETKTVVIASRNHWKRFLSKLQDRSPRTQLYPIEERPW